MKAYIVDILKQKDGTRVIRMVGEVVDNKGKRECVKCQDTEQGVIESLKRGKYKLMNATVENGKLKGTTGSLDRFNGKVKPFVLMSQLVDESGVVLGYKLADCQGRVAKKPVKEIMTLCKAIDEKGGVPVQNAQYVSETADGKKAYLKAYPGNTFEKELFRRGKNQYIHKPKVDKKEAEKAVKSRLEDIFSAEQIKELKLAKSQGMNIKKIGNPKLSAEQMRELRMIEEAGFNCELLADPAYKVECLEFYRAEVNTGADIKNYMNPKYNVSQLFELSAGAENGLDISKYANPDIDAQEMAEVRVRLGNDMWKEIVVKADPSWKDNEDK